MYEADGLLGKAVCEEIRPSIASSMHCGSFERYVCSDALRYPKKHGLILIQYRDNFRSLSYVLTLPLSKWQDKKF